MLKNIFQLFKQFNKQLTAGLFLCHCCTNVTTSQVEKYAATFNIFFENIRSQTYIFKLWKL